MSTKEEVESMFAKSYFGHPSMRHIERIEHLEQIVLFLAEKIDKSYQDGYEHGYDNGKEDAAIINKLSPNEKK